MITHLLDTNQQFVIPMGQHETPMFAWARQYPNMYTIRPSGIIRYADYRALMWLELAWPECENITETEIGQ